MSQDYIGGLTMLPGGVSMVTAAADGRLSLVDARTSSAAALAAQVQKNFGKQPLAIVITNTWCLHLDTVSPCN